MKYSTEWDFAVAMVLENASLLGFNPEKKMALMIFVSSVNIICDEPKKLVIPDEAIQDGWKYNEEVGEFEAITPEGTWLHVETLSFYSAMNII